MADWKFTAPCGHRGTPIIATYVRCDAGCDYPVKEHCPKCGSDKVRPFVCAGIPPDAKCCEANGHVWWPGTDED